MIPKECKRVAEVDFPIAKVSEAATGENKSRGHPTKLHTWWARRPLPSCRAILMALLLPDPCDLHCPKMFKEKARGILLNNNIGLEGWAKIIVSDAGLRQILLEFIAEFSNWKNAIDQKYVKVSRLLVEAAHGTDSPLVVDPFAGGGSIPLEALRLGCEAFASDLNPVACLILRVMLEDIPHQGPELAEQLRMVGGKIKEQAQRELENLYPVDVDGSTPSAYLWARTVRCEAPNCGAEIPLIPSFWLCKQPNRKVALRCHIERPTGVMPRIEFEIFEPKLDRDVPGGTVVRAKATCICCGAVLPPDRVCAQLVEQNGGADTVFDAEGSRIGGARMTAVVTLRPGQKGRFYRLPTGEDYVAVREAQERVARILDDWEYEGKQGLCPIPNEPTPAGGGSGAGRAFSVQRYGMLRWGDLFTARQKVALIELVKLIGNSDCSDSLRAVLACSLSLFSRACNGNARLRPNSSVAPAFGMQTLPITWMFPETVMWGGLSEHFDGAIAKISRIIKMWPLDTTGQVQQVNATDHTLPDQSASVWFTDPPYYDAIPYSDLSDFFLVWLKRVMPEHPLLQDPFESDNPLSPKTAEIVQDETKSVSNQPKNRNWYKENMTRAFQEGRRIIQEDGVGSVVFAHKTTEGWEALLSGMIRGGWTITGSWPIATETPERLRSRDSAALATSVHLICRPRSKEAAVGDWADVLRELPKRVSSWMERLEREGVRGADLVFACIGPALEIFSRYRAVETAEGHEVTLAEYLKKVWEVVGRTALEQILGTGESRSGDDLAGALEEDARLTALFLWTLQSTRTARDDEGESSEIPAKTKAKGFSLPFDVVRRFAQPMGIDLDSWNGSVISQQKGIVRLLPVMERIKDLFGEEGAVSAAEWIHIDSQKSIQGELFAEQDTVTAPKKSRKRKRILGDDSEFDSSDVTVLDRVHAAMLFQAGGHTSTLRKLIEAELGRGPEFLRLANALSALYPGGSQEKRLLDAMLLAAPK